MRTVASFSKLVPHARLGYTWYVRYLILLLTAALKDGTVIMATLQEGKLRLREGKYLVNDRYGSQVHICLSKGDAILLNTFNIH